MSLIILADDLTGACDTGALFAGKTAVPVTVWPHRPFDAPVRVIDTETREVGPDEARDRVAAAAGAAPARRCFKKIDSTLRGHVGAEVAALLAATGNPGAVLAPAFPAQGRTVLDRRLLIDGVAVNQTTLGRDPAFPGLDTADVAELVQPSLDRPLGWIPLAEVRAGTDALAARLAELGGAVAIADAETDEDLDTLVDAALAGDPAPLLVGSAGLGRALAARLGLLVGAVRLPPGRWLVVAGSRQPATRRQLEAARRAGLRVVASPEAGVPQGALVAARLAAEARRILDQEAFEMVAVSGGQTALALFRALGAERIDLIGPPGPGLAFGYLRAPERRALGILTKAGGFGPPDLFVSLLGGTAA